MSFEAWRDNDAADRCYMGTWWRATGRTVHSSIEEQQGSSARLPHQQPKSSDIANSFAAQLADDNSDTAYLEPISERVSYDMIN